VREQKTRFPSEQIRLFVRNFFKHPKMLCSLIPSSPFLIERLLDNVDWRRANVIVEYGPGVGTITAEMLKRMRPDARLIVIEMNEDFVGFLGNQLRDPRLHVFHGSAADVDKALASAGVAQADYIISGIPYSVIPDAERHNILRKSREALAPGGTFLSYQFSGKVRPYLERVFGAVRQDFELLNILPARLFLCTR